MLLIHTADYLHHPQPSRQHAIFEILAERHNVHTLHFHVSEKGDRIRETKLIVHEATLFPTMNPVLHYTLNAPYHYLVVKRILKENKIDVVVTSNVLASTAAIFAARNQNVPVLFDLSDWLPDSAAAYVGNKYLKEIVRTVVYHITQWNLDHSTITTTVSPSLKKKMQEMAGCPHIIMNGVDTDIFRPKPKTKFNACYDLRGSFVIGFSGAIEEWYDIKSMIRAMPKLLVKYPDTKLLLVGGSLFTDYGDRMKELVNELSLTDKVIFVGFIPYEQLPLFISDMDICAIPLAPKDWADIALPNKYFEYAAMGKPIIMTPIRDVIEIGYNLFVYENEEQYIHQIDKFRHMGFEEGKTPIPVGYSWRNKAMQFEYLMKSLEILK